MFILSSVTMYNYSYCNLILYMTNISKIYIIDVIIIHLIMRRRSYNKDTPPSATTTATQLGPIYKLPEKETCIIRYIINNFKLTFFGK